MKPNQHAFVPGADAQTAWRVVGGQVVDVVEIPVCDVCAYPQDHANHQVPDDPRKLLGELFEMVQREMLADRIWMTPERDALMLRCAKLLGKTLR